MEVISIGTNHGYVSIWYDGRYYSQYFKHIKPGVIIIVIRFFWQRTIEKIGSWIKK